MGHECSGFNCTNPASKKCGACGKVWYCSERCQRSHWKFHVFYCKRDPSKPINTAYQLYHSVLADEIPKDPDTCRDYGFNNAYTAEEKSNLLGLYIGLISYWEVEPIEIHRWRKGGTLVQGIINVFEKHPREHRGKYYSWFLQNTHLLDPSWTPPNDRDELQILKTWRFLGGDADDTYEQHRAYYDKWENEKQECFLLNHLFLSGWHPGPEIPIWVSFGFATCRDEWAERDLAAIYKRVTINDKCPLDDFTAAYQRHDLLTLFRRYGVEDQILQMPYMKDFLENASIKTVWHLKAYVYIEGDCKAILPVQVDYGIVNCAGIEGHLNLLKSTYKRVFEHPEGNPLELHEACITGQIFEYVDGLLKIKKRDAKVLRRLMKNHYPLAGLDE